MRAQYIIKRLIILLCLLVGLYPILIVAFNLDFQIVNTKLPEIRNSAIWTTAFYIHVISGGISLLVGWIPFAWKRPNQNRNSHRTFGKIYIATAIASSLTGIYLGFFSNGGTLASIGFMSLGNVWLYTTIKSYTEIRKGNITEHRRMISYSFAACFAGVTFRIWLPILTSFLSDPSLAYAISAWAAWIPNIIIMYLLNNKYHRFLFYLN
jgi:uncharacterized membrane protein